MAIRFFFGSGPGFVNRTQSDPGFVNPVRCAPGFVKTDPILSGPGFVNTSQNIEKRILFNFNDDCLPALQSVGSFAF